MSFFILFRRYLYVVNLIWLQGNINFSFGNELVKLYEKECSGMENGLNYSEASDARYEEYREMYTNCTIVNSNLEIVFLEGTEEKYDLSFLKDIREVRGYVLIYGNYMSSIPLTGLRVIRGQRLFQSQERGSQSRFGLYVAQNYLPGNHSAGLKELQLTSLAEILAGEVLFEDNKNLYFGEYTINWSYIFNNRNANVSHFGLSRCNDSQLCSASCHENCTADDGNRYCWGSDPNMCQTVIPCSQCDNGRCWAPNQCCDERCASGCIGPKSTDCLACRSLIHSNQCVHDCSELLYDSSDDLWNHPEVNEWWIYQERCVEQCPENMVKHENRCLQECSLGFMEGENKECIQCSGRCQKTCLGSSTLLNGKNIRHVSRCRTLNGSLQITNATLYGAADVEAVSMSQLSYLNPLEEITGSLTIEAWHERLMHLSFFKNLKTIGGQRIGNDGYALKVTGTSLEHLGLFSLIEVKEGDIYVSGNSQLCYTKTVNWKLLFRNDTRQKAIVTGNKDSAEDNHCSGCSGFCSYAGCWGPFSENCMYCPRYILNGRCVDECPFSDGFYESLSRLRSDSNLEQRNCLKCHDECNGSCSKGRGPAGCDKCKNVRYQNECKPQCPPRHYIDQMKVCRKCHNACHSCTGNSSRLGLNGCKKCSRGILRIEDENTKYCILDTAQCAEDYYVASEETKAFDNSTSIMHICRKCDPECIGCKGQGSRSCIECRNIQQTLSGVTDCVSNCSIDNGYYLSEENHCIPCHQECKLCYGPNTTDCTLCSHVRIIPSPSDRDTKGTDNLMTNKSFCADDCPPDQPKREKNSQTQETLCSHIISPSNSSAVTSVIVVLVLAVVVTIVIVFFVIWRHQKLKRLQEAMLTIEEIPMISASKAKPDMSLLRLIKETELRRANVIGSGAFGTVYKGVWIPEKESVKIPVAIKVLQHTDTKLEGGLLEEARIMASVCHSNCVRILAVCMTAQMMLITQLMPLGCLLDYVRKEKSNIGSRALLLWSVQIAKGMKYLEDLGIVHRDLAARNVLVRNQSQVRITDFGLARLLDYDQKEVQSEEGKVPIKWLALESIRNGLYTHKSDVWSYGVTLWEMYTFGDKPYEEIRAHQVPCALERGERLPQPAICTIDIYMLMIKCWLLDSDARPTFVDLINDFTKMAQDPGRFLVIPGDKLLRLSVVIPDTENIVRGMNIELDEPYLEAVSADDYYLRPKDSEEDAKYTYISENPVDHNYDYTIPANGEVEVKCEKDHLKSDKYQNIYDEEKSLKQLEENQLSTVNNRQENQPDVDAEGYQLLKATSISHSYLTLGRQSSGGYSRDLTQLSVECSRSTAEINMRASEGSTSDSDNPDRGEGLISPTDNNRRNSTTNENGQHL